MQFSRKTKKQLETKFFFEKSTVDAVPTLSLVDSVLALLLALVQELYICPCLEDLNSYYCTHAVFQENQNQLETKFFSEIKG